MATIPDRFYIDAADRELYEKLADELELFKSKSRKEQFLFTMAIGFRQGTRVPLAKKEGWFLKKDMKPEDDALVSAVAFAEDGSVDILSDASAVFKVAEEYAHAGIAILCDKVRTGEFGSFSKRFEGELSDVMQKSSVENTQEDE